MQQNTTTAISSRVFAYGGTFGACSIALNLREKVLPGIAQDDVITVFERDGTRTELERLLSVIHKGDHIILASIFTLEEPDDDMAMIHALHKLQRRGAVLHIALEPDFCMEKYDQMYKTMRMMEKQKENFLVCCGLAY